MSLHPIGFSHLVVELLQQTVQPGLSHLHGPRLVGYIAHFDQNHHQLHTHNIKDSDIKQLHASDRVWFVFTFALLSPLLGAPCWWSQKPTGWTWTCWESRCVSSCQWPGCICNYELWQNKTSKNWVNVSSYWNSNPYLKEKQIMSERIPESQMVPNILIQPT